jgi:RecB family exonuclease
MLQSNTLKLYPTSRAIRVALGYYKNKNQILPNFLTIGEFEQKIVVVKNRHFIDDDTRVLLLQKACDFNEFKKLQIPNEFFTFLKNSSFIFSFLDELAKEDVSIDELIPSDTYAEYEKHLSILKLVKKNYIKLLDEEGLCDKLLLPKLYELNEEYIKSFSKIILNLEGYMSRYEIELFLKVSKLTNLTINFQKDPFNQKMLEKLKVFDNLNIYEIKNNPKKIELASFKDEVLQVAFIKQKVYEFLTDGIKPEDIAIVLPDKSFAKYLQDFDDENNFYYAFGYGYDTTKTYKRLEALYLYQVEKSIENEYRLRRYFEDLNYLDDLKKKPYDEVLKELNFEEDEIYNEEFYLFKNLLENLKNLSFEKVLHLFLNRLSKRAIDDQGGKITVLEVSQTKGVKFKAIVIPNFNETKVPKAIKKDMFINSFVRAKVGLPTINDKTNLQKQLYQNIIYKAKRCAISYVENEQNAPSRFLEELDLEFQKEKKEPKKYLELFFNSKNKVFHLDKESIILEYDFTKVELSSTRLKTFLECRRRYYYYYIKKIKEHTIPSEEITVHMIGQKIHLALKNLYHDKKAYFSEKELMLDLKKELYKDIYQDEVLKFHMDLWLTKLKSFVKNEIKRFSEGYKIKKLEKSYKKLYNGFMLVGQIDRVDEKEDELYVLDYKTGKITKPTSKSLEKETNFQLQFYKILTDAKLSAYYDLNSALVVEENLFDEKLELLDSKLEGLKEKEIDFYKTEELKRCEYCPYKLICGSSLR